MQSLWGFGIGFNENCLFVAAEPALITFVILYREFRSFGNRA